MTFKQGNNPNDGLTKEVREAIANGQHGDPFAVLGLHATSQGVWLRAFLPRAEAVSVIRRDAASGSTRITLEKTHPAGLFAVFVPKAKPFSYGLEVTENGVRLEQEDPYRFGPILGELDIYLLGQGTHLEVFRILGAHPSEREGVAGTTFAVWAPNASRVSVVGDFNHWDGRVHVMRLRVEVGIWELFVPHVGPGSLYKYEILGPDGNLLPLKADPVAFQAELRPGTASIVHGLPHHTWQDAHWMASRHEANDRHAPMSIYECQLDSWARIPEEDNRRLTYLELADRLVSYVKEMGYTHIELLPITEYPFDASWGYQPTGMYAVTSRYGSPEAFAQLVDRAHQEGIGIILDWVPGHFPSDAHGLAYFDGTHLYEHADPRLGFHPDWNTCIYNYGRTEVANFLLGSALFWMECFHIDGLRVDAVASMLYLDYSRKAGEWIPNRFGGRENLEAIAFLRRLNELAFGRAPGSTTIAEESTAWPGVSRPTYAGGLGFGYKWNMGWMHDTLEYMHTDPLYRRYHHHKMTFGLLYAFSENFILPLSHDEVTHGKGSLINKMPGDEWQRFANLRAYYGFMWTHPGKKLLFMGGDFGQVSEWHDWTSLEWHVTQYPLHRGIQRLIQDLNTLYRRSPALYRRDTEPEGFRWVEANDGDNSVYSYLRLGTTQDPIMLVVSHFTPMPHTGYRIGVPGPGVYREVLNSDAAIYGGSNMGNAGAVSAEPIPSHGFPYSVLLTIPPLATVIFEHHDD